jgi:methylated-DNA-protein-cysteine methyltransferase-like protein
VTPARSLGHNALVRSGPAGSYERIYAATRRIPRGRVATYGQIAHLAGLPGHARQVGYALHRLATEEPVPWHRVINARGEISRRATPGAEAVQQQLLLREGVAVAADGRIDLGRYQWRPRGVGAPLRGGH